MDQTHCHLCGAVFVPTEHTTGYGEDTEGFRYCFKCCAFKDKDTMRRDGRIDLYLTGALIGTDRPLVSNWPGTLQITPTRIKRSTMFAFGHRTQRQDVWFTFEGTKWHGVNRGDNDIVRCRRLAK